MVQIESQNSIRYQPPQRAFTCSELTIKTLEQGVKYVQSEQYVNFEHILHFVLVFLL